MLLGPLTCRALLDRWSRLAEPVSHTISASSRPASRPESPWELARHCSHHRIRALRTGEPSDAGYGDGNERDRMPGTTCGKNSEPRLASGDAVRRKRRSRKVADLLELLELLGGDLFVFMVVVFDRRRLGHPLELLPRLDLLIAIDVNAAQIQSMDDPLRFDRH